MKVKQNADLYRNYYGRWGRIGWLEIDWSQYKVGTLVVDLIDVEKDQTVWHGAISGTIEGNVKNAKKNQ